MAISDKAEKQFTSVAHLLEDRPEKVALVEMQRKADGAVVNVICYFEKTDQGGAHVYPLAELLPADAATLYNPPGTNGKFETSALQYRRGDNGDYHPIQ